MRRTNRDGRSFSWDTLSTDIDKTSGEIQVGDSVIDLVTHEFIDNLIDVIYGKLVDQC